MNDAQTAGRPRRWWIAALLNLIFPPAGYAYVGAWTTMAAALLIIVTVPILAMVATLANPPGLYAWDGLPIYAGAAVLALILAGHAAWLALRAPPKTGSPVGHALIYAACWLAAFAVNGIYRAWWPNPTYSIPSASMEPTFREGDIVAVQGARAQCGQARPKPGDVIAFRRAGDPALYMHRAVAGPGQTVELTAGRLSIDGRPVARRVVATRRADFGRTAEIAEETLPNGARYRTQDYGPEGELDDLGPVKVPAGTWYVLGDSRDNAADSRVRGPVAAGSICAVGLKILASKDGSRVGQRP